MIVKPIPDGYEAVSKAKKTKNRFLADNAENRRKK